MRRETCREIRRAVCREWLSIGRLLQGWMLKRWTLKRWVSLSCLLVITGACSAWADDGSSQPIVLVLHNSFVTAEKFQRLAPLAEGERVVIRHLSVEDASPETLLGALNEAALIVLDGPRPNDQAMVEQHVEALSVDVNAPMLTVGGGRPQWVGIAPEHGSALAALYANGGEDNFRRFFALTRTVLETETPPDELLEPPQQLPATGFYHPNAPHPFEEVASYLAWHAKNVRSDDNDAEPGPNGRVAFLVYQGMITSMVTDEIDELIERTEAAGLTPIVFWLDNAAPEGLVGALEEAKVDVLVNLSHMQDGAARSRDFLALDIPVIQTLRFREGDASEWLDAPSGVAPRTTAVFLAGPEGWGISDPLVLSATSQGREVLLLEQADALIEKLRSLVLLRHTPTAEKRLALMFWNYPAGEKNLGASHLNIPRSLRSLHQALVEQGYAVGDALEEQQIIDTSQRMLKALYSSDHLDTLLEEGLADVFPLAEYERWLEALPRRHQRELRHIGGAPERHHALREINGQHYFVIPRWQLGNLIIMPQLPRHATAHSGYHDTAMPPDHYYMAAYLYLQRHYDAHGLIHLGTHGTQEWLPGKDRGLAASDYPWLALGSLPVFYPYIQDNVGESIQAKRRGRAVTISHQTPPFAPAGLYDQLRDLHQLIHEYEQLDEGNVRERVTEQVTAVAIEANLHDDLGWSYEQVEMAFEDFLEELHDHLHELARVAMPLGLHTFGQPADIEHRISTVMQQLGEPFYTALDIDMEELFAEDGDDLSENPAHQAVRQMLSSGDAALPDRLTDFAPRARELNQRLLDTQENEALLAGLAGRFVPPGAGGDPIRNPEVMSGRNLYAFEADKLPTRAAFESGAEAYEQLVQAFRDEHAGAWPQKLAFSLWSSEAIRHLGVTEAQVLHALGLRPVWDEGGRVVSLEIVPADELGRPRTDVVVQVTGVYRDQFDSFMRLLDDAMVRLAQLDEPQNLIAVNNQRIAAELEQQGVSADDAHAMAQHRLFSSAPGAYGTGITELAMRSTEWDDDAVLAEQFLASSRYAYGSQRWGEAAGQVNLLAEQLRGTQAAVMSRSSNLHGVLSTDHPFEFLGGLSAAVRHLDGQAPQLLISDLRSHIQTTGLARFLADELRVRYLNPQWIEAMQAEGYAGTLEVLNVTNNLFGWQVMDASTVRDDQWQALFDTYVNDTRDLGTQEWFETHNPTAQAQILERMAEAIRKGYWDASEQTQRELAQRWQTLEEQFEVDTGAAISRAFIADLVQGFGLDMSAPSPAQGTSDADMTQSTESQPVMQSVEGQVLEAVEASTHRDDDHLRWAILLMLVLIASGGAVQACRRRY